MLNFLIFATKNGVYEFFNLRNLHAYVQLCKTWRTYTSIHGCTNLANYCRWHLCTFSRNYTHTCTYIKISTLYNMDGSTCMCMYTHACTLEGCSQPRELPTCRCRTITQCAVCITIPPIMRTCRRLYCGIYNGHCSLLLGRHIVEQLLLQCIYVPVLYTCTCGSLITCSYTSHTVVRLQSHFKAIKSYRSDCFHPTKLTSSRACCAHKNCRFGNTVSG